MSHPRSLKVKGRVVESQGGKVRLVLFGSEECEDCGACPSAGGETVEFNTAEDFSSGEIVLITVSCRRLNRVSFFLYFVPALSAMAGFSAGYFLFRDAGGFFGALLFVALSYFLVKKFAVKEDSQILEVEKTGERFKG